MNMGILEWTIILLGVAFIVLKLCGIIRWSWLWVLAPFWLWVVAVVIGVAVVVIIKWWLSRKE